MLGSEASVAPGPDPEGLEARLVLAQLRGRMFGRAEPVQVGPYRLVRLLGRGAHGSVYEAEDERLRRRLALKLLRANAADADRPAALLRRLREARALAQLNHPNVVEVFAAGVTRTQVWIAMELVEGTTALEWSLSAPHRPAERLESARPILEFAARGLAAAHARGLVHRDFKPANVLLGADGRVKVADFGLARAYETSANLRDASSSSSHHRLADLAATTGVAGTPRYMSPEQLRGEQVDASSDQFNFAVTAWELAFGGYPFAGDDPSALLRSIEQGDPSNRVPSAAPRHFVRALCRALAPRPAERFASMDALRVALYPPKRRRGLRSAAAVGALAIVAAFQTTQGNPYPAAPTCDEARAYAKLETIWDDARRRTVGEGLGRSRLPGIDAVRTTVEQQLDAYGRRWVAEDVSICQAHRDAPSDGERARALDVRAVCLRHGLDTLDALLRRFESTDAPVASRAIAAVRSLPDPAQCSATEPSWAKPGREDAELRRRLAAAQADQSAGRYAAAAAQSEAIVADALRADALAVAADALAVAGWSWAELNDPRRFDALKDAYYLVAELGDGRQRAARANSIAMQCAYDRRLDCADYWIRHVEAALDLHEDPEQRATLLHVRGIVHLKRGNTEAAVSALDDVLSSQREPAAPAGTHELRWLAGSLLAQIYVTTGRLDEANDLALQLHDETTRSLGASHPRLAQLAMTLGRIARARGDQAQAIARLKQAVDLSERAYGPINRRTAIAYLMLAWFQYRAGDLEQAESGYARGLEAIGTTRDQFTVRLHRGLGTLRADQGHLVSAMEHLREAVRVGEEIWPPNHPELAQTRRAVAELRGLEPGSERG